MIHPHEAPRRFPAQAGFLVFLLAAVVLLFYVKWDPYFHKAFKAAAQHTLGSSIVTGTAPSAPAFSWQAAIQYGIVYVKAIWEALVAGLLLGAGVQVLLPKDWLKRILGRGGFRSSLVAGAAAVPSMM